MEYSRTDLVLGAASEAQLPPPLPGDGAWVQWRFADGGNDHWYAVVDAPAISWTDARDAAAAVIPGQTMLATPEANWLGENRFITSLLPEERSAWWLGGFQLPDSPRPTAGWQWLSGEPWAGVFGSGIGLLWAPGEPNDWPTHGDEDKLAIRGGAAGDGRGRWNDVWNDWPDNTIDGYVVEWTPPGLDQIAGDTSTTAFLTPDATIEGAIDFIGDTDWYRVSLPAAGDYFVEVSSGWQRFGRSLNELSLFDEAGAPLLPRIPFFRDEDGALVHRASGPETIFVSIGVDEQTLTGDLTGRYTLDVVADDWPQDPTTAAVLELGVPATGQFEFWDDSDWYALGVESGVTYRIVLERDDIKLAGSIELFAADGSLIDVTRPIAQDFRVAEYTSTVDEVVFVAVTEPGIGSDQYTLSATALTSPEPGPDPEPGPEWVQWRLEDGGNDHWYRVVAADALSWTGAQAAAVALMPNAASQLATVTSAAENAFITDLLPTEASSWWLGGFQDSSSAGYDDPDGAWRWLTENTTPPEDFAFTNWRPGEPNDWPTFGNEDRLMIEGGNGANRGRWNDVWNDWPDNTIDGYVVEFAPGGVDQVPGDTSSTIELTLGDGVRGRLEFIGDEDWYKVVLPTPGSYFFSIDGTSDESAFLLFGDLAVFDTAGNELDAIAGPWVEQVAGAYEVTEPQTVFVAVSDLGTGSYTVSARAEDAPDGPASPTALEVGTPSAGRFDFPGDRDWFKLDAQAGSVYTITLAPGPDYAAGFGDSRPEFAVRALDGNLIEKGQGDSFVYSSAEDRSVFVTVQAGAFGGYELDVTAEAPDGLDWVEWGVEDGGNGHFYARVDAAAVSWTDARAAAASLVVDASHLATVTSAAENAFVTDLLPDNPSSWWLGGYQDSDATGYDDPLGAWGWVGENAAPREDFVFANWRPGEPNDWPTFGNEDRLMIEGGNGANRGRWNDLWDDWPGNTIDGYVVEISDPAAISDLFVAPLSSLPDQPVVPSAARGGRRPRIMRVGA